MNEVYARLDAFYAKLPKIKCQGKCWNSCGPIDMSEAEWTRVNSQRTDVQIVPFSSERSARWAADEPLHCDALGAFRQCKIYDVRPTICRLWGVAEAMPCPHGCVPEGGRWLTDDEGFALLMESMDIGGGDYAGKQKELTAVLMDERVRPLYHRYARGDRSVETALVLAINEVREELGL